MQKTSADSQIPPTAAGIGSYPSDSSAPSAMKGVMHIMTSMISAVSRLEREARIMRRRRCVGAIQG